MAEIATLLGLSFILGLLLTGVPGSVAGLPLGMAISLLLGLLAAGLGKRVWRGLPRWAWLIAGLLGFVAGLYFQVRLPQPSSSDVCHAIWSETAAARCPSAAFAKAEVKAFAVDGKVVSAPRLTRSQKLQFELAATEIRSANPLANPLANPSGDLSAVSLTPQPVTGRLYVTLPRPAGEQLYPGRTVTVTGKLYAPQPPANPGGFNFEKYLAQQGIFAGLNGMELTYLSDREPAPLLWAMRQRIVQVQERGLGNPEGALVSAMVMGKAAVDIPYEIQDQFKQTGLAHALAASGTQVTLLVGVVLALSQRLSNRWRFGLGSGILLLYLGLTGLEPSVLRAGIMGFVALAALTANRKVKPLGSLLMAAVALLIYNPLWVWDLGFLLSFLATLGLLVTVPIVSKWFDWLPSNLIPIFAIPISAYLWTLPLMLAVFGVVAPYSILINIIVSPLIALISLGGMISAVGALIYPELGSLLAWTLYYPTHGFLKVAELGSQLPGANFAVGTVHPALVVVMYGLIGLIWRWPKLHRYWWLALMVGMTLVAVPAGYSATQSQVTVLATAERSVLVVQDQGTVGLIHSGHAKDAEFIVLPFLQRQGVNHLDWVVAPQISERELDGLKQIFVSKLPRFFYSSAGFSGAKNIAQHNQDYRALQAQVADHGTAMALSFGQTVKAGLATVTVIHSNPDILAMQLSGQTWLWFDESPSIAQQERFVKSLKPVDGIGWSGQALSPKLLEKLNPKLAIDFGEEIDSTTELWLQQHQVELHRLQQEGAVRLRLEQAAAE